MKGSPYVHQDQGDADAHQYFAEDQKYEDLQYYFEGRLPNAFQVAGRGSLAPDADASQLPAGCTHPQHLDSS